jgi:DNA-binding transcriptional LysR family regulator
MRDVDLHLLNVFDAIMAEGSVTRASERLGLSQPAVSNAIGRMRLLWNDPMFVRDGRGVRPTPKALELWRSIAPPLQEIRGVALSTAFNPATTQRRFRLAVNDFITYPLWPRLRRLVEAQAPGVDILAVPWQVQNTRQILLEGLADMALSASESMGQEIRQQWVFDSHYFCAMRKGHPLAGRSLTLKAFLGADHLLVSLSGDPVGLVDDLLAEKGLRRRIAMTINNFYGLVDLLVTSDLICVMSDNFFRHHPLRNKVVLSKLPFTVPSSRLSLAWHVRNENDAGHSWLRERILPMCTELFGSEK